MTNPFFPAEYVALNERLHTLRTVPGVDASLINEVQQAVSNMRTYVTEYWMETSAVERRADEASARLQRALQIIRSLIVEMKWSSTSNEVRELVKMGMDSFSWAATGTAHFQVEVSYQLPELPAELSLDGLEELLNEYFETEVYFDVNFPERFRVFDNVVELSGDVGSTTLTDVECERD